VDRYAGSHKSKVCFVAEERVGDSPFIINSASADAHVLIAFLAYCLQVTLKNRLMIHAPGLTPAAVFEKAGDDPKWSKSGFRCWMAAGWCYLANTNRRRMFRLF